MESWSVTTVIYEAINISWRDTSGVNTERKYLSYTTKGNDMYLNPIKVTSYDAFYSIHSYYPGDTSTLSGADAVIINIDKEELTLREQNKDTLFSLRGINAGLLKKYNNSNNSTLRPEELTFVLTENNRSIKVMFQAYALKNPQFSETDTREYANVSGWALVKQ